MLPYQNTIPVAAHRGNSRFFPENTDFRICAWGYRLLWIEAV